MMLDTLNNEQISEIFDFLLEKLKIGLLFKSGKGGGFADILKLVDGFVSFSDRFHIELVRPELNLSRSSVDNQDVLDLIDFNEVLDGFFDNSFYSKKYVEVDLDFNSLFDDNYSFISQVSCEDDLLIKRKILFIIFNNLYKYDAELNYDAALRYIELINHNILLNVKKHSGGLVRSLRNSDSRFVKYCKAWFASKFIDSKDSALKIVIHLRLGDTYCFTLSDGRLISAWGSKSKGKVPCYVKSVEESYYPQVDLDKFLNLVSNIYDLSNSDINLVFLSDGFQRGLDRVLDHKKGLKLSDSDIEELRYYASDKEKYIRDKVQGFSVSQRNTSTTVLFGESNDSFLFSFLALCTAEILVRTSGGFAKTTFEFFNSTANSFICDYFNESSVNKFLSYLKHKQYRFKL